MFNFFFISLLIVSQLVINNGVFGLSGNIIFDRSIIESPTNEHQEEILLHLEGDGVIGNYHLFKPQMIPVEANYSYCKFIWKDRTIAINPLNTGTEGWSISISNDRTDEHYALPTALLKSCTNKIDHDLFNICSLRRIIPIGVNEKTIVILIDYLAEDSDMGYSYLLSIGSGMLTIYDFYQLLEEDDEMYVKQAIKDYKLFHNL